MSGKEFHGNLMTAAEKVVRLNALEQEIAAGNIDEEIRPYLKRINAYPFVCTTQSCTGHEGDKERSAHFDFRCTESPSWVIDNLLKPIDKLFSSCSFQLYGLHCDRLRYCVWMPNDYWRQIMEYFISLLEGCYA